VGHENPQEEKLVPQLGSQRTELSLQQEPQLDE
jgi:hypothetical protein